MNCLLVAINAKYIHTSLSVRYLAGYSNQVNRQKTQVAEFTINHRPELILEELFRQKPDLLCFSTYLWNVEMVLEIAENFKKVSPSTTIVLGGPEVSFDAKELLEAHPFLDGVLIGEGEASFADLVSKWAQNADLSNVKGIAFTDKNEVKSTPLPPLFDMDLLPFPYGEEELSSGKILYYESSRGCPFNCQYCLSSLDKKVRFRRVDLVLEDLQRFLDAKVKQVKFVDRTFNCKKNHAMAIWTYLATHDNGVTNFHFELSADLLDEEMLAFLATVRKGIFQFEIGIQSTNPQTIEAIDRRTDLPELFSIIRRINAPGNIHQHLDLIAGLPYEGLESFERSFNDVYFLAPQQLQLGFLKVLKGSGLHRNREKYGLVYRSKAPYEILETPWLPFADALKLKEVEEMVELYLNSGRFSNVLDQLMEDFDSPFQFFLQLGEFYHQKGYHLAAHGREEYYTILKEFYEEGGHQLDSRLIQRTRLDNLYHERPRKLPDWAKPDLVQPRREELIAFFTPQRVEQYLPGYEGMDPKEILKQIHVERFSYPQPRTLLFRYDRRDLLGRALSVEIPL